MTPTAVRNRVGWQDRDWARLNDDELEELYRISPGNRTLSARRVVWTALAIGVVAVAALSPRRSGCACAAPRGRPRSSGPTLNRGTLPFRAEAD
jgi:hypothetical protein